jgi:hypothetical protein
MSPRQLKPFWTTFCVSETHRPNSFCISPHNPRRIYRLRRPAIIQEAVSVQLPPP